jgi:hypothetical protein
MTTILLNAQAVKSILSPLIIEKTGEAKRINKKFSNSNFKYESVRI